MKWIKDIGILVTIILAVIGGAMSYGQLREKANTTEEKVESFKEAFEEDIKEHEEDIDVLQEYSIRQSVLIERITHVIDKLEEE